MRVTLERPLLEQPDAVMTTSDLRALGYPRRAIDAILRQVPVLYIEGYARALVKVSDFLSYVDDRTFTGDRVRA